MSSAPLGRQVPELFYGGSVGDALIDRRWLPGAVEDFIAREEELFAAFVPEGGTMVEVGSMHGLHLDLAVERGLRYIGVDIVERYVAAGLRRLAALAAAPAVARAPHLFLRGDAARLDEVLHPHLKAPQRGEARLVFPFNSIGNMSDVAAVFGALYRTGLGFVISSYHTDRHATELRREYYESCGMSVADQREDGRGAHFVLDQGHEIAAYHPEYLNRLAETHGLELRRADFSELGVAYYGSPS